MSFESKVFWQHKNLFILSAIAQTSFLCVRVAKKSAYASS